MHYWLRNAWNVQSGHVSSDIVCVGVCEWGSERGGVGFPHGLDEGPAGASRLDEHPRRQPHGARGVRDRFEAVHRCFERWIALGFKKWVFYFYCRYTRQSVAIQLKRYFRSVQSLRSILDSFACSAFNRNTTNNYYSAFFCLLLL